MRLILEKKWKTSSPLVFPGRTGKQRLDIKKEANRIKKRAGLPESFRALQGLRDVYASLPAFSGEVDMCTLQKQHMGFLERTKKKLLRNFYDHGMWVLLKKCILHLIKPLYTKELIVLYKIDIKNATANKNHTNNYTFRFISSVDTAEIKQILAMEEWLEDELQDKLSGGSICIGAFDKDKLIGFYLATLSQTFIPLLKLQVFLKNDMAWGEQITVHRNYRRQNVARGLRSRMYLELKNNGIKHVYASIRARNKAALKSIAYFSPEKAKLFRYFSFLSYETLTYGSLSTQQMDSIDKLNSLRQSQYIHVTHDIVKKTNTLFEYNLSF